MKVVFFLSAFLISSFFIAGAYGDAISPVRQIKAGIMVDEIVCNDNLVRMVDPARTRAVCVRESTVPTFVERGWEVVEGRVVQIVDIETAVNPISTTRVDDAREGRSSAAPFNHVFEVCAGHMTYTAPKVIIRSDIETKSVTISADVPANSCLLSAATIYAINPDTIRTEVAGHDNVMLKISAVGAEIDRLTQQLESERVIFAVTLAEPDSETKRQNVDESIVKIAQLRNSLTNLKDDLNRYYFVLYGGAGSRAEQTPGATFGGAEITGNSVSILAVTPARTQGSFDVAIEMCAGSRSVADPMVVISSDTHERTLKLNRISADSCYKTGAKIDSISPESISVRFADGVSAHAALEMTIRDLEAQMSQRRAELASLTQGTVNPDPAEIGRLTGEMSSLRDQILTAKALLHQSLYKAYKSG